MKANELRIGNLHYYHVVDELDERKEWDEVCITDIDDLVWLSKNPDDPEYKPIPLTEDILRKAGFRVELDESIPFAVSTSSFLYVKENIILHRYKIDEKVFIQFHFRSYIQGEYKSIELDFIHSLQNLWTVLNGNELEVKI